MATRQWQQRIDGNKRVGANAAITFLLMNNWEPTFDEEELVDLVLSVASGTLSKPRLIEIFEIPLQASRRYATDPRASPTTWCASTSTSEVEIKEFDLAMIYLAKRRPGRWETGDEGSGCNCSLQLPYDGFSR